MKTGNGLILVTTDEEVEQHTTLVYNRDGFAYVVGDEWFGKFSTVVEAKNAAIAAGLQVTAVYYPIARSRK